MQSKVLGVYTRQNIYAHVTTVTHICYVHVNAYMVAMEVMVIQRELIIRDEPILPEKFLEKYESKEQNSGKIGGVSWHNQMLYLNK